MPSERSSPALYTICRSHVHCNALKMVGIMSQVEAVLTTMWSGVLSIPQETSGTSLVVIDIINLLHTQTEVRLPMRVPFEGPTIEQMAASLVAQQAGGVECVPPASPGRWLPFSGPPTVVAEGRRLSASGPAESSTPRAPATSTTVTRRPHVAQPLARAWQTPSRAQTTSETASGEFEYGAAAFFAFEKDGNKHAARKGGRSASARGTPPHRGARPRMVLTELGNTSKIVTDLTKSQHLNSHIRQSVAGAAAGTLRQYLQQWTFSAEWAQECVLHPGQPSLADMADYLHEVVSGAWQDRSHVRTGSVAGVIQSWTFVGREAQSGSLLAVLEV